jgi:hypothetical protein
MRREVEIQRRGGDVGVGVAPRHVQRTFGPRLSACQPQTAGRAVPLAAPRADSVFSSTVVKSRSAKIAVPLVIALVLVAIVVAVILSGAGRRAPADTQAPPAGAEVWRCNACARIQGKNWQSCRTVTGRGTEKAASDLVRQRVCEEAADPATQCTIGAVSCKRLSAGRAEPRPAGETGDPGGASR